MNDPSLLDHGAVVLAEMHERWKQKPTCALPASRLEQTPPPGIDGETLTLWTAAKGSGRHFKPVGLQTMTLAPFREANEFLEPSKQRRQ